MHRSKLHRTAVTRARWSGRCEMSISRSVRESNFSRCVHTSSDVRKRKPTNDRRVAEVGSRRHSLPRARSSEWVLIAHRKVRAGSSVSFSIDPSAQELAEWKHEANRRRACESRRQSREIVSRSERHESIEGVLVRRSFVPFTGAETKRTWS